MPVQYRRFKDVDDREVWASYDGENIEILLQHDINIGQLDGDLATILAGLYSGVEQYLQESSELMQKLLWEECGIVVGAQYRHFPVKGEPPPELLHFTERDPESKDGYQYKIFHMQDFGVLASKSPEAEIEVLYWDKGLSIRDALLRLMEQKTDFASLPGHAGGRRRQGFYQPKREDFD